MSEITMESKEELEEIAVNVLQEYDINPEVITIIQSGSIKTLWKISTADQSFCLKRLRQVYDKVLFSANAQIYIKKSGGSVPGIILDKKNKPIVQYNNQLFVIYEWLEGRDLDFKNSFDFELAVKGLAKFHKASKGYEFPENAKESSKFGKWQQQYISMKNKFEDWKDFALINKSNRFHALYLEYADSMIKQADLALELLEQSQYQKLTASDSDLKVICHQDYGKGNVILTSKGVYVLDLDSVTYDLPARDLRKIIGKLVIENDLLDIAKMNDILNWYTTENPLSQDEKTILYIDLLFPHWFYGLVKNQYLNNKEIKLSKLDEVIRFEEEKISLLTDLIK